MGVNLISPAGPMRGFEALGHYNCFFGMAAFTTTGADLVINIPSGVATVKACFAFPIGAVQTDETLYHNATADTTAGTVVVDGTIPNRTLKISRTGASPTSGLAVWVLIIGT